MAYLADSAVNTRVLLLDQSGREAGQVNVAAGRYTGVSVSRDGRLAVLSRTTSPTASALWMIDLETGGAARLTNTPGLNEAYVQLFPKPGRKFQATTHGAAAAWWRNDGKQLLIGNVDLTEILVADVQGGDQFFASIPRVVGRLPSGIVVSTGGVALDVTPDFHRLVALVPEKSGSVSIARVQNWAPRGK